MAPTLHRSPAERRLHPRRYDRSYLVLREMAKAFEEVAARHVRGGRLVDYGCGDQPYRPMFDRRVDAYIGADLPDNPQADVHLRADGGLPLDDESADIVLSSQVLEHVPDPDFYLAEAWRVLRPGGTLILSTHGIWWYHAHPTDFWRWTHQGLRKAVGARFEIVHFEGLVSAMSTGLQLWQDYLAGSVPKPARPIFYTMVQGLMAAQERFVPREKVDRDASTYLVVATKPAA